ncbi:SpoIIE family protein phosphatase [Streptomyces sp. NPDC097619]|uniref:SpoIIE family protein phosphatase n=1 Tax=Streptomyces sp. NPDC097619 TaxID=3157228 RepID=UPI003322F27B
MDGWPADEAGEIADVLSAFEEMPLMLACYEGEDLRLAVASRTGRAAAAGVIGIGDSLLERAAALLGPQGLIDHLRDVMRSGEPVTIRDWRMQFEAGDGLVHDFYVRASFTPWHRPDGTIRGVVVTMQDTTEETRALLASRTEHAKARADILALQQALLPDSLPVLPAVQVAARYALAQDDTAAGGDWFDAVPTPTGRLALVVGDVVGHGVTASATMGQLRALLRARLTAGADPATAVAELDAFARIVTGAGAATVCVAELDPATGTLRYITAGHPAPILLAADGTATYLAPTPTAPLATTTAAERTPDVAIARVPAGGAVLLYSDGILERPGLTITTGQDELLRTAEVAFRNTVLPVGAPVGAAERLCVQSLELLTRYTGHGDDITLLAAHRTDPTPPLVLRLPAGPGSLEELRFALGLWLLNLGIDGGQEIEVQHAVGELVTNAIEHAYNTAPEGADPTPAPHGAVVEVRADIDETGTGSFTVVDRGLWREPGGADPFRGHGLSLVQAFGDLALTHDDVGTRARFTRPLTRPVALAPASSAPTPRPAALRIVEDPDDPARVIVSGVVDTSTSDEFDVRLRKASHGASTALTADLTGVVHLASCGVQVLHHLMADARANGTTLTLVALDGTPAATILDLVRLPRTP